jgi:hypothetical protein
MRTWWVHKLILCGIVLFLIGSWFHPNIPANTLNTHDVQPNGSSFIPSSTTDWWPMFRHDACHSGFTSADAPEENNVLWSYQIGYVISSSPAVAH